MFKKDNTVICSEKRCGVLLDKDKCSLVSKVIDQLDVSIEKEYFCPEHKKPYWYKLQTYTTIRYFKLVEVDENGELKNNGNKRRHNS